MCFYHEYDWHASVSEEKEGKLTEPDVCTECRQKLNVGEYAYKIYQQEKECCDDCECENSPDCHCESCPEGCDLGEVYDYTSCEKCELIRKAIRAVEESEGCEGDEAEPSRGQMSDDICNGEGWGHYLDRFLDLGLFEAYEAARIFRTWRTADHILIDLKDDYPNAHDYYHSYNNHEIGGEA